MPTNGFVPKLWVVRPVFDAPTRSVSKHNSRLNQSVLGIIIYWQEYEAHKPLWVNSQDD
jgi:hypothetical protein